MPTVNTALAAAVAAASLALAGVAPTALAEQPLPDTSDPGVWTTNGAVSGGAQVGDTSYFGGNFTYVGPATGGGVLFDPATGTVDPKPQIDGSVVTSTPDGNGGFYAAGFFQQAQGQTVGQIVHFNADGSLDAGFVAPSFEADIFESVSINALLKQGGKLYVGGHFKTVGGQAHASLVALDPATGAPDSTAFNIQDGSGNPDRVNALAPSPNTNTIYVGGSFAKVNGNPQANLVRLNSNGTPVASSGINSNLPDGEVDALYVDSQYVYVGGNFTKLGSSMGAHLRRYAAPFENPDTGWKPAPDSTVRDIDVDGTKVFFTGDFAKVGGSNRASAAAVKVSDGSVEVWNPAATGVVTTGGSTAITSIEVSGDTAYLGGNFTFAGGEMRDAFAELDTIAGNVKPPVTPSFGGAVATLSQAGDHLFVGGSFISVGGARRRFLAALGPDGKLTSWNPGADRAVTQLVASPDGQQLYIAGDFNVVHGATRTRLAAVKTATEEVLPFAPNPNDRVRALAISPDGATLWAGGDFSMIGQSQQTPISYLAALDTTSGDPRALDAKPDGLVFDLALPAGGSPLYLDGTFTHIGAQDPQPPRQAIAAIDATTAEATAFAPQLAGGGVLDLTPTDSGVFLAGTFTAVNGTARDGFAKLTTDGQLFDWTPGSTGDGTATALTAGGNVLVGGRFSTLAGGLVDRANAGETDATTGTPLAWHPRFGSQVDRFLVAGRTTWVFGGGGENGLPGGFLHRFTRPADPPPPGGDGGGGSGGDGGGGNGGGGGNADTTPPQFLLAKLTHKSFRPARGSTLLSARKTPRGTTIKLKLSEPASLRIAVQRAGHRRGKRCSFTKHKGKRCFKTVATLKRAGVGKTASIKFTGRIGKRALKPGAYRFSMVASDAAGNRSKPRRLTFRVR